MSSVSNKWLVVYDVTIKSIVILNTGLNIWKKCNLERKLSLLEKTEIIAQGVFASATAASIFLPHPAVNAISTASNVTAIGLGILTNRERRSQASVLNRTLTQMECLQIITAVGQAISGITNYINIPSVVWLGERTMDFFGILNQTETEKVATKVIALDLPSEFCHALLEGTHMTLEIINRLLFIPSSIYTLEKYKIKDLYELIEHTQGRPGINLKGKPNIRYFVYTLLYKKLARLQESLQYLPIEIKEALRSENKIKRAQLEPLTFIPPFLEASMRSAYGTALKICPITQKPIRFVVVIKGQEVTGPYYEREAFLQQDINAVVINAPRIQMLVDQPLLDQLECFRLAIQRSPSLVTSLLDNAPITCELIQDYGPLLPYLQPFTNEDESEVALPLICPITHKPIRFIAKIKGQIEGTYYEKAALTAREGINNVEECPDFQPLIDLLLMNGFNRLQNLVQNDLRNARSPNLQAPIIQVSPDLLIEEKNTANKGVLRVNYAQRYENGEISYAQYAQYRQGLKYGEIFYTQSKQEYENGKLLPSHYEQMLRDGVLSYALYYAQYARAYKDEEISYEQMYENGEISSVQYTQMYRDGIINHALCERMYNDGMINKELYAKYRQMHAGGRISCAQYYALYAQIDVREYGHSYTEYKRTYEREYVLREMGEAHLPEVSMAFQEINATKYRIDAPFIVEADPEIGIKLESTWKKIPPPPLYAGQGPSKQQLNESGMREAIARLAPRQHLIGAPPTGIAHNFIINGLAVIAKSEIRESEARGIEPIPETWYAKSWTYLAKKITNLFSARITLPYGLRQHNLLPVTINLGAKWPIPIALQTPPLLHTIPVATEEPISQPSPTNLTHESHAGSIRFEPAPLLSFHLASKM
ncbi:MAG: hypothetical protein P4L16_04330 [Chlamydiales bacterium]|nr:hypothetical protein [Chlamydiales bacterium]